MKVLHGITYKLGNGDFRSELSGIERRIIFTEFSKAIKKIDAYVMLKKKKIELEIVFGL